MVVEQTVMAAVATVVEEVVMAKATMVGAPPVVASTEAVPAVAEPTAEALQDSDSQADPLAAPMAMAAMTAERYTPGREVASAAAADAEAAHQVAAPGAVEQLAEARTAEAHLAARAGQRRRSRPAAGRDD